MAHFLITECTSIDRHTEPEDYLVSNAMRYEKMTIKIELMGSGNTIKIPTEKIISEIMKRLDTIE